MRNTEELLLAYKIKYKRISNKALDYLKCKMYAVT